MATCRCSASSLSLITSAVDEDKQVADNVVNSLTKGSLNSLGPDPAVVLELLPVLPTMARELLPQETEQA